ncbi:MAG TPA: hypothetical protein VGH80_10220 [Xanthomonadaceae bacterium]|jgi:hypothetical protein
MNDLRRFVPARHSGERRALNNRMVGHPLGFVMSKINMGPGVRRDDGGATA